MVSYWIKKSKDFGRQKKYDLFISSATPFTDHLIGYFIKKRIEESKK